MTKSQIFVDDILHAFESEGNLHLVLGVVNGSVDEAGNDLREVVTTLIIPNNRANTFSESLKKALKVLLPAKDTTTNDIKISPESEKVKQEFLGQGVKFSEK